MNAKALLLAALLPMIASGQPSTYAQAERTPEKPGSVADHPRGFDFLRGEWQVRHRRLRDGKWAEFDGTMTHRPLMNGWANMEEYVIHAPAGSYQAIAPRSYDPETRSWSIWRLDGRYPRCNAETENLEPPVVGRFDDDGKTFHGYGDFEDAEGRPMRARFIWSRIDTPSPQWEQAVSADGGKTWETNWIFELQRPSARERTSRQVMRAGAPRCRLRMLVSISMAPEALSIPEIPGLPADLPIARARRAGGVRFAPGGIASTGLAALR